MDAHRKNSIETMTARDAAPITAASMLIERHAELGAISSALRDTEAGTGSWVAVLGPSGIGKSALVLAAGEMANACGWTVLAARATALEQDFAFGVVRQLLERSVRERAVSDGAAEVFRRPLSAGAAVEFAVHHGLYWLVNELAEQTPVLLCIDDLQLCDAPSLHFVQHLVRRLDGLRVAVVASLRNERDRSGLPELLATPGIRLIQPKALSSDGVSALLERLDAGDGARKEFGLACFAATGGNPFLVTELLLDIRSRGLPLDDTSAAEVDRLTPRSVARAVLLRLAELGDAATAMARAVAILGDDAPAQLAAGVAGIDAGAAASACDALARAEVLVPRRPLRFVHPMLAEAVLDDLSLGARSEFHERAARLLAEHGAEVERVASHLVHTEPRSDPEVVATLRSAAAQALGRGSVESAHRFLARAESENIGVPPVELLRELGEIEWLAGDADASRGHLDAALERSCDPEQRAQIALVLARVHASVIEPSRAAAALTRASTEPGLSADTCVRLHTEAAMYALLTGAAPRDIRRQLAEVIPPEATTTDDATLSLHCSLAATCLFDSDAATTLQHARSGLRQSQLFASGLGESFPVLAALTAFTASGDQLEAQRVFADALQTARALGSTVAFAHVCAAMATAAWGRGDLRACEQAAREAIEPGFATGYMQPILYSYLALTAMERAEWEDAEQALAQGIATGEADLHAQSTHRTYAVAHLHRLQGRPDEGLALLRQFGDRPEWQVNRFPFPPWRLEAAECLVDLDHGAEAAELVAEHLIDAQRWGTPAAVGATLRVQARTMDASRRGACLRHALDALTGSPARLEHALALVDLGVALLSDGQVSEAQQSLRDGYDEAWSLDASRLAGVARRHLISTGIRPRRRRINGVDALTPRERRVCDLAITGQSNTAIAQTLFVTRSTVEKHLGRAYTKLGISSREQLTDVFTS